eukprot:6249353-Pyramimonas_sp.AAC.1
MLALWGSLGRLLGGQVGVTCEKKEQHKKGCLQRALRWFPRCPFDAVRGLLGACWGSPGDLSGSWGALWAGSSKRQSPHPAATRGTHRGVNGQH